MLGMNQMQPNTLISANEALSLIGEPDIRFADATWYLPDVPKNAHDTYKQEHIPGAVHFDIDSIADASSDLPHMFPSLAVFSQRVGELGISEMDRVIVYDRSKFVASARAWWMFRSFGHPNVRVLDGGLSAWKNAGGVTEGETTQVAGNTYRGSPTGDTVILRAELAEKLHDRNMALIDARSQGRFGGSEPEPRPGLRSGHIPGSLNLYYGDVMDADGFIKPADQIADILESLGVGSDDTIVTTCGSGVTAAILLLAIHQLRQDGMRLYDGSWTEWASHPDSPMPGN